MDIVSLVKDYTQIGVKATAEKYGVKKSDIYEIVMKLRRSGAKIPKPKAAKVFRPWQEIAQAVNAELHPFGTFKKVPVNTV